MAFTELHQLLRRSFFATLAVVSTFSSAHAQGGDDPDDLKKLTLEELMNIQITTVSRRPEDLSEAASAVQVITRDAIRRSGATSVPEALRLAQNLQVAQLNSSQWIISARGFNAAFSNKLLVMIDGRTVYSPLFAGVFWDVQHVLLEDIDRIEVISGPGGTTWGANAVNGVINIITRKASETEGLYLSGGVGNMLRRQYQARYAGKIGSGLSYRVYAMATERDHTYTGENPTEDSWYHRQTGLSLDWRPSEVDEFLVHSNFYVGAHNNVPDAMPDVPESSTFDGQNILGRWTRTFSDRSRLMVQGYFDRTWRRDVPSTLSDQVNTLDLDIDHSFALGEQHNIVWGLGYRFMRNQTISRTEFIGILPNVRDMPRLSMFIQDEFAVPGTPLALIVGTKLQHNVYTGFEYQPSARLAWKGANHTLWSAVSRAVRTPSRIDVDYFLPVQPQPPELPSVAGGPNFDSERVLAYELGYRFQAFKRLSASISAFHNRYNHLYSVEALPGTLTFQIQNGTRGVSQGVEFAARTQIGDKWTLRGGYTYFHKELENKPGHVYDFSDLGHDAKDRFLIHSSLDLPAGLQFDFSFRYIGALPTLDIPDYSTFDARLAWVGNWLEVSVIGQNLWEERHREYLATLPRNIYASVTCRF